MSAPPGPARAEHDRLVRFFAAVAAELGHPVQAGASVLDFGCGAGGLVRAWDAAGFEAVGCDVVLEEPGERLHLIEQPYRLPFPDASFDFAVSNQVLEHVQDHDVAFRELRRVLKPGAASLHLFPARWTPLEVHLHVPLGGIVQERWWLALWARLGIRNAFQQGLSWREVAALNHEYLATKTNYLSRADMLATARAWFEAADFVEALAIKHGRRTQVIYPLVRRAPAVAAAYGAVRARLLFLAAPVRLGDP